MEKKIEIIRGILIKMGWHAYEGILANETNLAKDVQGQNYLGII
jgi:hypothetical protein